MDDNASMPRREFLTKGAAVLGAAAAAPLVGTAAAQAAAERALAGIGRGELGLVGLDHVGLTVPDINQAIEWFEDVLGAVAPLTFGPLPAVPFVAGASTSQRRRRSTRSRCSASATAPTSSCSATPRRRAAARHAENSDWSGHHVAFYVTDIDTAVEYMVEKGVPRCPQARSR